MLRNYVSTSKAKLILGFGASPHSVEEGTLVTREQLDEVEDRANYAVYANYPVKCYFPDEAALKDLDYRSKLDLTEGVRLVDIENTDLCACCAPHVNRTGEVGVIKILDFMRHRGGVRIVMKSGLKALFDYRMPNIRSV